MCLYMFVYLRLLPGPRRADHGADATAQRLAAPGDRGALMAGQPGDPEQPKNNT